MAVLVTQYRPRRSPFGIRLAVDPGSQFSQSLIAAWAFNVPSVYQSSLVTPSDRLILADIGSLSGVAAQNPLIVQGGPRGEPYLKFGPQNNTANVPSARIISPSAVLKPTDVVSVHWAGFVTSDMNGSAQNNPSFVSCALGYGFLRKSNNTGNVGNTDFWFIDNVGGNSVNTLNTNLVSGQLVYNRFTSLTNCIKSGSQIGYVNGAQAYTSAHTGAIAYGSFSTTALEINDDGRAAETANANPYVIYIWRRFLTAGEAVMLHGDPYAPLRAPIVRNFFAFPTPAQSILPSGIASSEAFGTLILNVEKRISPSGIATAEAFGSATLITRQDTFPSSIASAEAFGHPDLNYSQTLKNAGAIASLEAFGTPNVARQQFAAPAGIPSAESLPTPIVGLGTLTPASIASQEAFGSPTLNVQQVLAPTGIASAEVVSTAARVSNALSIHPSGIASAEAIGAPNVRGSSKKLNIPGIASAEAFGRAQLTGPGVSPGLRIWVGGREVSSLFQSAAAGSNLPRKAGLLRSGASGSNYSSSGGAQPLTINQQTIGRWTTTFDLVDYDGSLAPQLGQTVIITEPGFRHFAGCLTIVEYELVAKTSTVIIHCTARDKSAIFDRRVVRTPSYPAGMDIADVARDLVTNYADGEGVTTNGVPASLGPLVNDFVLPGQLPTLTSAMDALALLIGGVWFIDTFCDLTLCVSADLPTAPFAVSTKNSRGFRVTSDSKSYATAVYAVSNLAVKPGSSGSGAPIPTGISVTETFTLPQASAVARGFLFGSIITQFPILAITSLKVNGVKQTVYLGTQLVNLRHCWWYFPGAPYITPPNVQNTNPFPDPPTSSSDPTNGDVVEVQYVSAQPTAQVERGNPLSPTGGTCGSGIWEKVIQAQNIQFQGDLDTLAAAQLAIYNQIPKLLSFETDIPGLQVGMKLATDATLARIGVGSTTLLVTALQGVSQKGEQLGHGSCLRWTVSAYNTMDPGNDLKFWERVIQRGELPAPLVQPILPTMVLFPGSSLGGGTVSMAPLIVGQTAQVSQIAVACESGPVNEDVYIDIQASSSGSLLDHPLKIPAGTAAGAVLTFSQVVHPGATWIYQNEVVYPVVTVTVTGANPQAPTGVSVQLRGQF